MNRLAVAVTFVLFVLAAIGITFGSVGELDLIAAGLAAWALSTFLPA